MKWRENREITTTMNDNRSFISSSFRTGQLLTFDRERYCVWDHFRQTHEEPVRLNSPRWKGVFILFNEQHGLDNG